MPQRPGHRRRRRSSARFAPRVATRNGRPVPLSPDGETLFQLFSTPSHGCQVQLPPEAVIIARRIPIPLFGAGLVEAIPDEAILALADPDDRDRDGISGRARSFATSTTGRRSRRAIRLEGAARDAAGIQRRRLSQRDGDHQRLVSRGARRRAHRRSNTGAAIRFPIPRIASIRRLAAAASTTSRRS